MLSRSVVILCYSRMSRSPERPVICSCGTVLNGRCNDGDTSDVPCRRGAVAGEPHHTVFTLLWWTTMRPSSWATRTIFGSTTVFFFASLFLKMEHRHLRHFLPRSDVMSQSDGLEHQISPSTPRDHLARRDSVRSVPWKLPVVLDPG